LHHNKKEGIVMKNLKSIFFPAILVTAASIILILYSFFGVAHQGPNSMNIGSPPQTMELGGQKGREGVFRTIGTIAIFCGAVSYAWLQLKKKRRSSSSVIQFLVKWFDKLHQFAGYAAIFLITIHGFYFLVQAAVKRETYTGIAAFALLLSLGGYGFLIRRVPNKYMRKVHFLLTTAFAVVALIHAGGSAIAAVLSIIAFWVLIRLIDRKTKKQQTGTYLANKIQELK
jgi:hypothetical protein